MKSTENMNAIDFTALAQLTKDNKTAGIIAMLAIGSSKYGQVTLTNKGIIKATGLDRGQVSVALRYLKQSKFMLRDPIADDIYHINSQILRTHDDQASNDADYFPEFSAKFEAINCAKSPKRSTTRVINKMNKLSDTDISNSVLTNGVNCPQIEEQPKKRHIVVEQRK